MATFGFRVWDAAANQVISIDDRLFRIIDIIQLTANGNVTDAGLLQGQVVWALLNNLSAGISVSVTGATLTWTADSAGLYPCWFMYGVR